MNPPISLDGALDGLDDEAKRTVMLAVQDNYLVPPMARMTRPGEDQPTVNIGGLHRLLSETYASLDIDKVDQMMRTGQIAYPMMMKKAPIISIINSKSGLSVSSADEQLARVMHENLQEVLPRTINEILTFLEYGAYYGEVIWGPAKPQDYGITGTNTPYWVVDDLHACHPRTIQEILRNKKTGKFEGFEQKTHYDIEAVKIGLERALIIPNGGTFGNLEGTSILKPVYVWWFWYELIWRAFLRFLQRAGVGVVLVKAPSRGRVTVSGSTVDAMDWGLQLAGSIHKTNYAVVPSDTDMDSGKELWTVDYLKTGDVAEGRQFIEAINILGDNIRKYLMTGDQAQDEESAVMIDTEQILSHITTYFNRYVMRKALYWNSSSARTLTIEAQGASTRILPLLFKLMAVAGNTAGDALRNVNWRELFNKGGVPILSEEEVEELEKEQLEKAKNQQEVFAEAKNSGKGTEEKAKGQPDGEGRHASERDKKGEVEKLEMLSAALNTSLIVLGPEQVAELEALGIRASDKPVVLFNPYHDELGRFTTRSVGVGIGATGLVGGMIASGAGIAVIVGTAIAKKVRDKKNEDIAITYKYKGKKKTITYGDFENSGVKMVQYGILGGLLGITLISLLGVFDERVFDKWSDEQYKKWYEESSKSWGASPPKSRARAWPTGATQDQFKDMYRGLAKAFHPDRTMEDTNDIMSKINNAYDKKDWEAINDMFETMLSGEDESAVFLMVAVLDSMYQAVEDGTEYIAFPALHGEPFFPTEDGLSYIDANTIRMLHELLFDIVPTLGGDKESTKLFNPYHDEGGRFTTKEGAVGNIGPAFARRIVKERKQKPFEAKGTSIAVGLGSIAGVSIAASAILSNSVDSLPVDYQPLARTGSSVAKAIGMGSGAASGLTWGVVNGRLSVNHFRDFITEVRREIQYKGKNKKAVWDRIVDTFNSGRKSIGRGAMSAASIAGGLVGAILLYESLGGTKTSVSDWFDSKADLLQPLTDFVGSGWAQHLIKTVLGSVKFSDLEDTWLTEDMVEALVMWMAYFSGIEDESPLLDSYIDKDIGSDIASASGAFLAGYGAEIMANVGLEQLKHVELFNPFHDKIGRFTTKQDAASISGQVSQIYEKMGEKPVKSYVHDKVNSYLDSVCGSNKACRKDGNSSYATYIPSGKNAGIHISPNGAKVFRKDKKFGRYTLVHEAYHSRTRSNGKRGASLSWKGKDNQYRAVGRLTMEEGTTDLLARRASGVDHEYWRKGRKPYYTPHMGAIAMLAAASSGGNRDKAWKIIDQMHYHINDDKWLARAFGKKGFSGAEFYQVMYLLQQAAKKSNYQDLAWLFGG